MIQMPGGNDPSIARLGYSVCGDVGAEPSQWQV
jgi:hypothetical protein